MLPELQLSQTFKSNKCVKIDLFKDKNEENSFAPPARRAMRPKLTSLKVNVKDKLEVKKPRYKIEAEYDILGKLGFGSYSQVYLGKCLATGKEVAIKKCKGSHLVDKEYKLLTSLSHEFIPEVFTLKKDEYTKTSYMVMEYVEGVTLDKAIEEEKFTETEALIFFKDLLGVLKHLHSQRIAHRDIKHQNVIVHKKRLVKLIDFNISKKDTIERKDSNESIESLMSMSPSSVSSLKCIFMTQAGSPQYCAPEVLSGDAYSEKVDIWGLGLLTYSCLNGVIEGAANETNFDVSELNISDKFKEIISSCLKPNPDERASAEEINIDGLFP